MPISPAISRSARRRRGFAPAGPRLARLGFGSCPPDQQIPQEAGGEERLIEERRRKLEELRDAGVDPFPYEFRDRTPVAEVLDRYAGLHGRRGDGGHACGWPAV